MLDDVTKKRINTLRQILVGKLPDPKAQVEQITNALIYKFMNDMDEESLSMGGKATYFSGSFQKYSWKNLMNSQTSGVEKLSLYAEALNKMTDNENLPTLFRDIFKDSVLPFKDPATLNMFLKEINEFHYSNSEKLGDAFEYLLSFMGSQGDAGQFRTPRHIIDFITEIVNPQKNETVLDPACGTAGFLISSYKHILKQNTKKNLGDGLNVSDRKKIGENLNGYDISPDMVKMSLVNMYLHKFTNPKINEYDTLSSEDKWNEYYDVILANPPFFSPKGGITPHNRFGVNSSKAEVLFVDYINEHLKPNGRAGIIVPEGIISNPGAYKQLRKKLIETSLIAVIDLPSGIFLPYSGVKTNILILDKNLNKKLEIISFFEIHKDGFDLTNSRRKINDNDIPNIIKLFRDNIDNKKSSQAVKKEIILSSDNIYLSKNHYVKKQQASSKFDFVKLGDVCKFQGGSQPPKEKFIHQTKEGYIRFIQIRDFSDNEKFKTFIPESNKNKLCNRDDILIGRYGASVGDICTGLTGAYNVALIKCINDNSKLTKKFLYYYLKSKNIQDKIISLSARAAQAGVNPKHLNEFDIPLPSLEIQNKIITELDDYQKVIDGCRQVIENYKPSINIDPKWEMAELGEIFTNNNTNIKPEKIDTEKFNVLGLEHVEKNSGRLNSKKETFLEDVKSNKIIFEINDILYGKLRPNLNKVFLADFKGYCSTDFIVLRAKKEVNLVFYSSYLLSDDFNKEVLRTVSGAQLPRTKYDLIKKIKIPKPELIIQNKIGDFLTKEKQLISNNKSLILNFQTRVNEKINKLFD